MSRQALFQTVTFDAVAPPFLYYAGGLKFWLNDIRDCAIDTLPEDERHFCRALCKFGCEKGELDFSGC